jgi:hypothetical protein
VEANKSNKRSTFGSLESTDRKVWRKKENEIKKKDRGYPHSRMGISAT